MSTDHPSESAGRREPPSPAPVPPKKDFIEETIDQKLLRRNVPTEPQDQPHAREIQLTPRQRLERGFRDNPANIAMALELAQLHLDDDRPFDAEKVLAKAVEASDDDPSIRRQLEEVQMLRSKKKLEAAEQRAQVDKTYKTREVVTQLKQEHNQLELQIFTARFQREPQQRKLAYEIGLRYKQLDQQQQAFEHFEAALHDDKFRAMASLQCGECQQRFKDYPKAMHFYRQSIQWATELNQSKCKKLALYRAGVLASGMRLFEPAKRYFSELLQIDPNFRDADQRLEQLKALDA